MRLIDPEGRRHAQAPARLRAGLAALGWQPGPGEGLGLAAHGFVEIAAARGGLAIRLRPLLVSGAAMAELGFLLAEARPARVVLHRFDEAARLWRHAPQADWRAALEALEALEAPADPTRFPDYAAAGLADTDTDDDGDPPPLARLRRDWREAARAARGVPCLADASGPGPGGWPLLVRAAPEGGLRLLRGGGELAFCGAACLAVAPGAVLEDQPDRRFAARLAATLRRALIAGEPLLQRVEATLRPAPDRTLRVVYRRLVLPWRLPGGGQAATAHAQCDLALPLPLPVTRAA
jgi:hypothetical protein